MAMCGALLQFVPVLVSGPLYAENWALPAFVLLTAGLITLLSGFLALGGRLPPWLWLLPVGAGLLVAGFGLIAVDLALTVWRVRSPGGPARFVLVGIAALCATAGLGTSFAWKLAGHGGPALDSLLQFGVPLHAIAGLGGWLTITAMGVSYRLLSMFMLSPDIDDRRSTITLLAGAAAIGIAEREVVAVARHRHRQERPRRYGGADPDRMIQKSLALDEPTLLPQSGRASDRSRAGPAQR